MIRAVDLRAIGWADGLILADDSRWQQIAGAKPRCSAVIYNSPNLPENFPASAPDLHNGFPEQNREKLRLAYIGLLQVERGLIEMLELLEKHPEWSLDIAGFGGDEERIRTVCQGLPNCRWHGRVAYERALELSQAADVLFATYDPAIPNHRYSSPNKVFEAMLLAKPIIVARDTNMDRIILQADCGIIVEYGNIPDLEAALLRLEHDPALRLRLGRNAYQAYVTIYSWAEMEKRLQELYRQALALPGDNQAQ